jgi:hypothetical protein
VGITGPAGQVRYYPETGRLLHWQEEEEAATFGFATTINPEEQEEAKYGF